MWRHEDIFFGAFGGGGIGNPISSPEEIAERAAVGGSRCLPACPFMHGTAHWMAFQTLFTGGTVVIDPSRRMDPVAIWELVAREQVNFLVIVGDAMGRPLVEALEHLDPSVDVSCLKLLLSGGAILSPAVKRELAAKLSADAGRRRHRVVGDRRSGPDGRVRRRRDPVAAAVRDGTREHRAHRRPPAGCGRRRRQARPPRSRADRLLQGRGEDARPRSRRSTACAGRSPATTPASRPTARITVLGRGSVSINTGGEKVYPEEVEGALKSHPDVFDAVVVGVPDARWGERVVAVVQPRDGCAARVRGARRPRPRARRGLQGAARRGVRRRGRPIAVREARLPMGEADRDAASPAARPEPGSGPVNP